MTKSEPNFFLEFLKKYRDDPVGFVRDILRTKPDPWQIEFLKAISSGERRISVRSGHGVGKSTAASWAMLHYFLTRYPVKVVVTAPTSAQLFDAMFAELKRWVNELPEVLKTLIEVKADRIELKAAASEAFISARTSRAETPEALQGIHADNVLLVADEASGIPKPIWTVTEGFFTEPIVDRYWFCFSNPRRNTGEFFECFHKNRGFWNLRNLDSRKVEGTDTNKLNEIILKHGEDSDEARVEVLGQFPRQGDKQFISREIVMGAVNRELVRDEAAPLIMGIDVARYGDDKTVFRWRQGRDARSIPPVELKGLDNMQVANFAAEWIEKTNPDAVCVDAGGSGSGVVDRLKERGFKVHEIWFGSKSEDAQWGNKRTELWDAMREWLNGGCIDARQELLDDLSGPEYDFQAGGDKIILEPKESMKSRGLASPDHGDALVLTFSVKVAWRDARTARNKRAGRVANDMDYDIFGG